MSHPFEHPKASALLERVTQFFHSDDTYIVPNRFIIFVCGGPMEEHFMRPQFCKYVDKNMTHLRVSLAEKVLEDYRLHSEGRFQNIAEFEDIIAEVSSCVILFPESPGSFAELGYFARSKTLRKKLLIANNARFQGQDSFIALGPINLVDQHSHFKPTVQIAHSKEPEFGIVNERLKNRINPSKNRKKFKAKKYGDLTIQLKFYSVFEIIRIFQALTFEGIVHTFKKIWGNAKKEELRCLLSILISADCIKRFNNEPNYFCINRNAQSFLDFGSQEVERLTLEIIDFYENSYANIAMIVRGLGG